MIEWDKKKEKWYGTSMWSCNENHGLFDNWEEIRYNLRPFVKQWGIYELYRVS